MSRLRSAAATSGSGRTTGAFVAAGVEAANAQVVADDSGTQADLAKLINRAAAQARVRGGHDDIARASYRFGWPDPLFGIFAAIHVVGAAVLLVNDGPIRLLATAPW